uniref:PHD-type domain-containing protein n=1 Tax=Tetraodon nigroviridis TaxID=99883 RepID=H3BWK2_TETNG
RKRSQSASMFSPQEPEIKLRYLTYKEEKRDPRAERFSPFVHVERQQSSPSLCTVVNYPEEVRTDPRRGQQMPPGGFATGAVPSTSCLQLGRASALSQHQRSLVCCLCGQSANAMDLGDLHGPYYPEGYRPAAKGAAGGPGLKEEEDDSDSDSFSSSVKERGRKRAVTQPSRRLRPAGQPWASDGTGGPTAKRAPSDADSAGSEDWYSAPVLPLEPCEYWLHEDCGIWSAGVYLVKGKVYGLEEAFRLAQDTKCSACGEPGATLGCTSKRCPNKYHYRCALEAADCVLIEENFSMKCRKHKQIQLWN